MNKYSLWCKKNFTKSLRSIPYSEDKRELCSGQNDCVIILMSLVYAELTQLGACLPYKEEVVGSSPTFCTTNKLRLSYTLCLSMVLPGLRAT